MYRCERCGKVTKPREKQNKKIIKTRKKIYHNKDKYGKETVKEGYEIVKEINICDKCLAKEEEENENND